ncbi:MAG TPA: DNA repair protein RecO [Candidatus Binatia bacterium]|nr:DNA repair protein RecO [Candidatus Binatia bacterium]
MRVNSTTRAIVLRTRPFGESDKIVSFFTEGYGKLTGIAKGALRSRRRFVNSLESFALVNLSFHDRPHSNLAFILSADLIHGFRTMTTDLERISYASYLVEITDGLTGEREQNPTIFQHLKDGLCYLAENGTSLRFLTVFELKLLRLAGYQPVLDTCKKCRQDHGHGAVSRWHFSPAEGGILCDSCARSSREILPLDSSAVEVLLALQAENDSLPGQILLPLSVIKEIRAVVLQFIQFHMDREIKSAPFLQQFSSV